FLDPNNNPKYLIKSAENKINHVNRIIKHPNKRFESIDFLNRANKNLEKANEMLQAKNDSLSIEKNSQEIIKNNTIIASNILKLDENNARLEKIEGLGTSL
ncbi:MAG: hypothetical protein MHPSP_002553, partial [Paramarteilia canceri]